MSAPNELPPADDPWALGARASQVPIVGGSEPEFATDDAEAMNAPGGEGGDPDPEEDLAEEFENAAAPLRPNRIAIAPHLSELFAPTFVHAYPDSWIEIAYASPEAGGKLDKAKHFSAFDLAAAAEFAEAKSNAGYNVYVGVGLRGARQLASQTEGRAPRTFSRPPMHGPSSTNRETTRASTPS